MSEAYTGIAPVTAGASEYSAMEFIIRAITGRMCTMTLVQVRAVGAGTVDVQPMVHQTDGAGNVTPHGIVHGLPVWTLQGGTSAVIVTPVVGDIGVAVFAREDITSVRANRTPSAPGSRRRYSYSDGVYFGGALNPAATQFLQMDPSGVTLTAAPAVPMVINAPAGLTINGNVATIGTLMNNGHAVGSTHQHSGVATGTGTSGPPL